MQHSPNPSTEKSSSQNTFSAPLKIIFQNVRKWHTYKSDFINYYLDLDPDIIILNSTSILENEPEVKIPQFHCFSSPKSPHNGTSILIKKTIKHKLLEGFSDPYFLAIRTFTSDGEIILSTHYCPFDKKKPNTILPLSDLNKVLNLQAPLYFLGDLNAKHTAFGHSFSNARGKRIQGLADLRRDFHYIGPNFNTWMLGKKTSKPDIIFTNNRTSHLNTYIEGGPLLSSDHRLIIFQISTHPIPVQCPPMYDHQKANNDLYKEILEQFSIPNLDGQPRDVLDEWWEKVVEAIVEAAKASRPFKTTLTYRNAIQPSHSTKTLAHCYTNISNFLLNQPSPSLKHHASLLLDKLKQSWGEDIYNYNIKLNKLAEESYKKDPKAFFKIIDRFRGNFSPPTTNLNHNGKHHRQPEEILKIFKEVWQNIYKPNPIAPSQDAEDQSDICADWCESNKDLIDPHPNIDLSRLDPSSNLLSPIDSCDLEYSIRRFKKKAPGQSGIDKDMIKHLPSLFLKQLLYLYNATLSCGYMPRLFKSAVTILIPKINNAKNPKDYRPIALLEALAKIYESVINRRLKWHLEDNGLLDEGQFGFRPTRSTHHVLNILLNYVSTNNRRGRDSIIICKDVEKAFDTVWHEGLITKIFRYAHLNLPTTFCKTLASYLTDRTIRIKHSGLISDPFTPLAGVPQGSVLAPLMYILYISDCPPPINVPDNPNHPPGNETLPENITLNLFYADDNTIAVSGGLKMIIERAKEELQKMSEWEDKWRIKINGHKSRIIIFGPNRYIIEQRLKSQGFTLNPLKPNRKESNIPTARSHTILGVMVDWNLSFVPCIKQLRKRVNTVRMSFFRLIAFSNRMREFLYKCYILPIITYHYSIYSFLSRNQRLILQGIQNNCLQHFVFVWRELGPTRAESYHVMCRMLALNHIFHQRARKFYDNLKSWHPHWHNILVDLHNPSTRNHRVEITPLDWATNKINRPIYSGSS